MARVHFTERTPDPKRAQQETISRLSFMKEAEKRIEHIPGVQHLIAYLEPAGHEAFSVGQYKSKNQEQWNANDIREHSQWLRESVGKAPLQDSITLSLPKNIHAADKEQTGGQPLNIYNHNIWAWEPELSDDIERVKAKKDKEATQNLRALVRSGSWDSHAPVNEQQAFKLAEQWQKRLEKQPSDAQLELTAVMNPDLEPVKELAELFSSKQPNCGPEAERAADFLEAKLRDAWKSFNATYRETALRFKKECLEHNDRFADYPLDWPHEKFHTAIKPSVKGPVSGHLYDFTELHEAQQRIVELRQMRDQAYFHLLYPNLCSFIKRPKQKHTA